MKTKFIILADARTGSHMLQTAINTHPQIDCFGEILNPKSKESMLRDYTHIEAIKKVFSSEKQCSGFIIHRPWKHLFDAWEYLALNKDIKIIIMHRQDMLMRYASLKIAQKTKNWIDFKGDKTSNIKVEFDPLEFETECRRYNNRLKYYSGVFKYHQSMKITYENLVVDFHQYIRFICKFFGIQFIELKPSTFRQETRTPEEIFINHNDLKL